MKVGIVRPMPNFSMDVYADGLISGFQTLQLDWEISQFSPQPVDRHSRSIIVRSQKSYERFWRFPHCVSQQPADIFHVIDHSEAHLVRWLKQRGKKVIVTCHDLINFFYRSNLKESVRLPFISDNLWIRSVQSMKYADHIVSVSQTTATSMVELLKLSPEKISVIPNAVDESFQPLSKSHISKVRIDYKIPDHTLCLLNVGSNHPRKNIETILDSIALMREINIPVIFIKVGADFTENQKEKIKQADIEPYVKYIGNPTREHLIEIYNLADILIAPSFHEGFGLTLLEAMACGTPVITSNTSAMPEVVGEAGILVRPSCTEEISNAAHHLFLDKKAYKIQSDKALRQAAHFSWTNTSRQISSLYKRVIFDCK